MDSFFFMVLHSQVLFQTLINISCNITAISIAISISFNNEENAKAVFVAILVISDMTDI